MDTAHVMLAKPKKSENSTYIAPVYYDTKDCQFAIEVDNLFVVNKNQERGTINIKTSSTVCYNQMYDIAAHVVSIVKANFSKWFNTQMAEELVDEYFSNPLVYDKKYGDIIRLRIVSGMDMITDIKRRCNMVLVLDHVRIYKQKFQLEWTIKELVYARGKKQVLAEDDEELLDPEVIEDMCIPIEEIRQEYISKLIKKIDTLNELVALLKTADRNEVAEIAERASDFV
jgi:hypothetical protein